MGEKITMNSTTIIFTALCCVLKVCVVVQGRYLLEVRLFGYSNPTGRCASCPSLGPSRSCCDAFDTTTCSGAQLCDSLFMYCSRALGNTLNGCHSGRGVGTITSTANTDDGSIDFSQPGMVLGLDNPLLLPGFTNAYTGVQLYVEILDDDEGVSNGPGPGGDTSQAEFVDNLFIDHDLAVGEVSLRQNRTGREGFATIDLTTTVLCAQNFQGSDCTQCIPGFTGTDCEVNIDDCVGTSCSGNGQCVDEVNSFSCICSAGYTGTLCDVNIIDECLSNPCGARGQCVDGVNTFDCMCDPGFTGEVCQTNIDDCVGANCTGNRDCVDRVNSFTCECSPGFSGPLCTEVRSNIGPVVGGVLGVVLPLVLVLILVIVVVILIMRFRNRQGEASLKGMKTKNGDISSGVEDPAPVQYENLSSSNKGKTGTLPDKEFNNPIYGGEGDKTDNNVYTVIPQAQTQSGVGGVLEHEFDNALYGTETAKDTYYSIPDQPAGYNTVTGVGRKVHKPVNGVDGQTPVPASEEVYDAIPDQPTGYDVVTGVGRKVHKPVNGVDGQTPVPASEEVYDAIPDQPAGYDVVTGVGRKVRKPVNGVDGQTPVPASEEVYDALD